ncbi:MAG: response regulator transcription factor [Candidatus Subteraquimicrobiales bacterium]|nr:response regulator transcription factor [Candidatus Subteraquimicrobiales bacterium]
MPKEKILIVDDDSAIAQVVSVNLEAEGYETSIASDGKEALEKIVSEKPSLVVLDIMLPKIDGWEVLFQVRENPDTESLPIILLSAKTEESTRVFGLKHGADDYIAKPFSPAELVARVGTVLQRGRREPKFAPKEEVIRPTALDQVPVRKAGSILLLSKSDIFYAGVKYGYAEVHTDKENYLTNFSLTSLQKRLGRPFFRVHRAYIVNLHKVKEVTPISKTSYLLKLTDSKETKIPVSRRQTPVLKKTLGI